MVGRCTVLAVITVASGKRLASTDLEIQQAFMLTGRRIRYIVKSTVGDERNIARAERDGLANEFKMILSMQLCCIWHKGLSWWEK